METENQIGTLISLLIFANHLGLQNKKITNLKYYTSESEAIKLHSVELELQKINKETP